MNDVSKANLLIELADAADALAKLHVVDSIHEDVHGATRSAILCAECLYGPHAGGLDHSLSCPVGLVLRLVAAARACEFCGAVCHGGACHNARVEDNARFDLSGVDMPDAVEVDPYRDFEAMGIAGAAMHDGARVSRELRPSLRDEVRPVRVARCGVFSGGDPALKCTRPRGHSEMHFDKWVGHSFSNTAAVQPISRTAEGAVLFDQLKRSVDEMGRGALPDLVENMPERRTVCGAEHRFLNCLPAGDPNGETDLIITCDGDVGHDGECFNNHHSYKWALRAVLDASREGELAAVAL